MIVSSAVILAAGSGERFGGSLPKPFIALEGRPLFMHAVRAFSNHPSIKEIVLVVSPDERNRARRSLGSLGKNKKINVVQGGAYRGASVRNGVCALSRPVQVVLIHDSARPFVTADIIERVEKAALRKGVALAAWPLGDTLKRSAKRDFVRETVPRTHLWLAQTPQGFRYDIALKCLLSPSQTATDDTQLAERKGYRVALVRGSPFNLKITYPHDLKLAQALSSIV